MPDLFLLLFGGGARGGEGGVGSGAVRDTRRVDALEYPRRRSECIGVFLLHKTTLLVTLFHSSFSSPACVYALDITRRFAVLMAPSPGGTPCRGNSVLRARTNPPHDWESHSSSRRRLLGT